MLSVDAHPVRRDVATLAVEIAFAHIERIEPERPGNVVDQPFRRHHALRATKTAEGGVGDRVRLRAFGDDARRRQVVAIVGVEHGAVVDRGREISRVATARREHHVERGDTAVSIEAGRVVGAEVMPLAGHGHVVVAVEPQLAGPAGDARRERCQCRPLGGLGFLAAEGTTHAPHFHRHGRRREMQHVSDDGLQLARMLGR